MFFWVFPRLQIVVGRRFGTLCQFHLQRQSLWRWNWHRVPKRRPTTIWRRGNTQKNIYNIQITAKVWNQEVSTISRLLLTSWEIDGNDHVKRGLVLRGLEGFCWLLKTLPFDRISRQYSRVRVFEPCTCASSNNVRLFMSVSQTHLSSFFTITSVSQLGPARPR